LDPISEEGMGFYLNIEINMEKLRKIQKSVNISKE
jgi:hypothetical protein